MRLVDITQEQMVELLNPLFEYVGLEAGDVSRVQVTASAVDISYVGPYGNTTTASIAYKEV